jgi:pimeloyl-ACP methyl ester carboxylesterase
VLGWCLTMALDPQKSLVFFLPGIMGSVLRYKIPDSNGGTTNGIMWGTDGLQNLHTLGTTPERLRAPGYAHSVIESVLTFNAGESDVYGSLMRFCSSESGLGLKEGLNFHPFPYDWRQDNAVSARHLASRIRELDPDQEKDLYFIAHSMGGLVCRIAISSEPEIRKRMRLLFQIASPIEGSPKAYWTLNKYPEFSKFIDVLYLRKHLGNPDRRAQLLYAVQSFTSAFQLLPPSHVVTLIGPSGAEYPARHPEAWPIQLQDQLAKAEAIQSFLKIPAEIPVRCVYSERRKTLWRFFVNTFWSITARRSKPDGDETVPASSAKALSEESACYEATGKLTEHTALCQHPKVHEQLRQVFE